MTRNDLKEKDDHGQQKNGPKSIPIPECDEWCNTEETKTVRYKFVWTIEKFSGLFPWGQRQTQVPYHQQFVDSCVFKNKNAHEGRSWMLRLFPNGANGQYGHGHGSYMSVQLICSNPGVYNQSVDTSYEISILDNNKTKKHSVKGNQVFFLLKNFVGSPSNVNAYSTVSYPFDEDAITVDNLTNGTPSNNHTLVARNSLSGDGLLSNDTLTLLCEITEVGVGRSLLMTEGLHLQKNKKVDPMVPVLLDTSVHHKKLFKDVNHIFLNKKNGYDVILKCGDQEFYCHKFMLSARSPVFEAMFFSDMVENKSGTVNVEDVDPDVMIEVLQYIYTGCSLNIDKHAKAILGASEKYLIEQLKGCCEDHLSGILDVENCVELLLLGERNNAKDLKKAALVFLTDNMTKFIAGDWKQKLKDHPVLVMEVMENLLAKK